MKTLKESLLQDPELTLAQGDNFLLMVKTEFKEFAKQFKNSKNWTKYKHFKYKGYVQGNFSVGTSSIYNVEFDISDIFNYILGYKMFDRTSDTEKSLYILYTDCVIDISNTVATDRSKYIDWLNSEGWTKGDHWMITFSLADGRINEKRVFSRVLVSKEKYKNPGELIRKLFAANAKDIDSFAKFIRLIIDNNCKTLDI